MSKELAEKLDLDGLDEKEIKKLEYIDAIHNGLTTEELKERMEKIRNREFVPKNVNSWNELWNDY